MPAEFCRIRKECCESGRLWEDPDFVCAKTSLYYHRPPADIDRIEWRRPHQIVAEPIFVVDDLRQFDVVPGKYGQNGFTSAVSQLYRYRGLFYRAVPADQGFGADFEYSGVFHFRFWWGGEWVEVLVDDRLPTSADGRPVFVHSADSGVAAQQFWPALLHKAYAKLNGSYEALDYASSADVLSELSGGAAERFAMPTHDQNRDTGGADAFGVRQKILDAVDSTAILTAVTHDKIKFDNGLEPNRNYGVIHLDKVHAGGQSLVSLVRMVLPPGAKPVTGPWSTGRSLEWQRVDVKQRRELGLDGVLDPATFWLTMEQFRRCFCRLETVYLDADTCQSEGKLRTASPYHMRSYGGHWRKGATAGGCRNSAEYFHLNPQLVLGLAEPSTIFVGLLQHQNQRPKVIGFSIYKAPPQHSPNTLLNNKFFRTTKAVFHSSYSNERQVATSIHLDTGLYVVLPTTYEVGQEGAFTLRIYSQNQISLGALDNQPAIIRAPIIKAPEDLKEYRDVFQSVADERKTVNAYELQELLHACLPNDYMKSSASVDVCRKVVQAFYGDVGRLNYQQFNDFICSLKVWQEIFSNYSKTTSGVMKAERLRDALADVGFSLNNDALQLLQLKYMRRDGTLRFGDLVACILHLIATFNIFARKDVTKSGLIKLNTTEWMKSVLRC